MPRRIVPLTLLFILVFAGRVAHASPHERAPGGKDLKRAEAVISKLRRLEEADARVEFERAASKLYPDLFASASALGESDLKTELSTAVALYESALRAGRGGGGGTKADCSRELRDSYLRLCREAAGDRALLLRAKARLHARRAETELLYARGDHSAETLDALTLIRAERATDTALAEEALHVLKELAGELSAGAPSANASTRGALTVGQPSVQLGHSDQPGQSDQLSDTLSAKLEEVERILAALPRDRAHQLLRNARDAFRDGLYWQLKVAPTRSLVVNVNAFAAPDALTQPDLRADDADRAAHANLRAALKFIRRAEEVLGTLNSER